ncbi:MAG: hydroxymethylglutaryl-CoA reductase (NADPH), partial [Planctomycetota bacterium]
AQATDLCARELAAATGATACYVHGQDVEKRANARAMVEGRGRSVIAEVRIPREALEQIGRARPEDLVAISRTYRTGYAQLGTQNWTIQAANGLAAIFLACGQDVAYVVESATGQLDLELEPDGALYAALTLPSLLIGTVGGGSGKGTAHECLQLMGCAGAGRVEVFAEAIAATILAGDISLMAAFVSDEFVSAHESLGRNRPESI